MDKIEIFEKLKSIIKPFSAGQDVRTDNEKAFNVYGKTPVVVGKKTIEGQYFASAIIQKNFVGFYFFPIYTHPDKFNSGDYPHLIKCLKGKSCFHIKKMDEAVFKEIEKILSNGARLYEQIEWRI